MSETAPITLVSPDGQRYDVPAGGVDQLKAKGFRDLTESEQKDAALQEKYGEGILPPVGAALSGAASGLSFGASDALIAQTPFAEANREISERNPEAHTAGQIASIAVPLAGELSGASLAGKAARAAGAGITGIGKAATLGGEAAGGIAKAVGMEAAAPLVRGAVQAGAEGAAFQIGNNVGEASRRDVALDAETLLAHVGEAGILGAGVGAVIPAAGKVVRWSADKAVDGLDRGVQGLRALGIGIADAGVNAIEAGAGTLVRNADNIGAAAQGAGQKIADAVDEHLLPRIREGLTAQTERPDIINDVFATGPEGQTLRHELGPQTITGTREMQTEALSKPLNDIWKQSRENAPLFDDLALAVKKDLQGRTLRDSLAPEVFGDVTSGVITKADETLAQISRFNGDAAKIFGDAVNEFKAAAASDDAEQVYRALDKLKGATGDISQFAKGAVGDMTIGAGAAAKAARSFGNFAKTTLEDTSVWGEAGQVQHAVNAAYTKYQRAFDGFEKFFASSKVKGRPVDVLDGAKIKKWAKDITGPEGQVRNKVVDDLVSAQTDLIALTDKLSQRAQAADRQTLGSMTAGDAMKAARPAPEGLADVLNRSRGQIENVASAKTAATKTLDRAEVLQQTQSAILSRQGAGVNPLPVEMIKGLGGGALLGHMVGGLPGAAIGGGLAGVLQKYGAITTNPKSAIQFLNTIDRLRGVDKERVASWVKSTLGSVEEAAPRMREAIASASQSTARKILEARGGAERGIEALASRADTATPGIMQRILPAVSYADVTNSDASDWWKRTQKAITTAQANPTALNDKLHKDVAGIADTLPDMAAAIPEQQLKVFGYLADKMPRNPRPYMLGDGKWTPDQGEMKAYRDLVLVATKPDALLPLITVGTATRAQVDAVRTLWPKKFEETKTQVVDAVMSAAADGHPVPYESRLRLGQLLGTPLDASQEPGFAQWIQAASQPAQPASPPAAPVGAGALNAPMKFDLQPDSGLPMSIKAAERK